MAISFYKIKKWTNMMLGNSVYHVCQDEGKIYNKDELRGYYNNLTEKVTRFGLSGCEVPKTIVDTGEEIYFSIAIFQYGLGAYDLYLLENDSTMLQKAIACADWAVKNQQPNGGFITFAYKTPDCPYSSMAQGEAISLLLRVYKSTGIQKYFDAAKKAKEFMLLPIESGGTAKYDGDDIFLFEYTHAPLVLNGFIFSLWGLFDYCIFTGDDDARKVLLRTQCALKKKLPVFDMKYWSRYDDGKRIASPFYHKLHIAQLRVMYDLFGDSIYKEIAEKWEEYQDSFWKRKRAFCKKVMQKIFE